MKKRTLVLSGSIVTTLLAAATTVTGVFMTNRIMYIKKKDDAFIREREITAKRFDEAWYDGCSKEILTINSPNGYTISGIFLKPLETNNTVIICHGVTENKINSMRYARMFERLGFNAVVYDHRRHGESQGKTTSYGHYEKFDLQAVVDKVRELTGEDALLGIHGESMGAATTLLYAGTLADNADFYISDCAFSNFPQLLKRIFESVVPIDAKYTLPFADFFMRIRDGYSVKEIMPIDAVKQIERPVLFIHSEPDDFIPSSMTKELFEQKPEPKMMKIFDKGEHAKSFNENPGDYEQTVAKFLHDYVPAYRNETETLL
ncbi:MULTISPECIES: alpha/beta hydrolase [Solibacillus]|uniref:Alpha/beta hydrolase n=1 Tax=Solibacillus merdavium TaxID=2762218 RepID=A0ABR8XJ05_9BACL|nr:alpha/beta hydrolase [Solibacillus merdavium]MBD8031922.1 alpha/beta hydrolase [Solibacillus merdavium]